MSEAEMTDEQIVEAIYGYAAEQMQAGVPPGQIQAQLVEKGLDSESAATVVSNLNQLRSEAIRSAGKRNMMFGALWCIGGTVITAVTYSAAASGGGTYVVAWGAILFGGIQFVRGLMQTASS